MFRTLNESAVLYRSKECEHINFNIKSSYLRVHVIKYNDCNLSSRMSDHYVTISPLAHISLKLRKELVSHSYKSKAQSYEQRKCSIKTRLPD